MQKGCAPPISPLLYFSPRFILILTKAAALSLEWAFVFLLQIVWLSISQFFFCICILFLFSLLPTFSIVNISETPAQAQDKCVWLCPCLQLHPLVPFSYFTFNITLHYIDICGPLDFSDQRDRINFHQPKRTAPDTAEDQTLQAPAAAHRVEWPTARSERPDGLPDQPQLVRLLVSMRDFSNVSRFICRMEKHLQRSTSFGN